MARAATLIGEDSLKAGRSVLAATAASSTAGHHGGWIEQISDGNWHGKDGLCGGDFEVSRRGWVAGNTGDLWC